MSNLVLVNNPPLPKLWAPKSGPPPLLAQPRSIAVKAFFFNPVDDPILKGALKEPIAFMGGMFAGLLKLDLNEEPLKEWVKKTVEASGIDEEEIDVEGTKSEDESPQLIDIE